MPDPNGSCTFRFNRDLVKSLATRILLATNHLLIHSAAVRQRVWNWSVRPEFAPTKCSPNATPVRQLQAFVRSADTEEPGFGKPSRTISCRLVPGRVSPRFGNSLVGIQRKGRKAICLIPFSRAEFAKRGFACSAGEWRSDRYCVFLLGFYGYSIEATQELMFRLGARESPYFHA